MNNIPEALAHGRAPAAFAVEAIASVLTAGRQAALDTRRDRDGDGTEGSQR